LTEISGIPGGSQTFGCRVDLSHFLAWRAGANSWYSTGETPPIKAGHQGTIPHLADYLRDSSHQRGTESAHQRDQGEVSSWRFRQA
jgi:hypothetical protein